jgi:hypothetical protein
MFNVNYYLNGKMKTFEHIFNTMWVAAIKARAIYEEHGIPADVVDMTTGEVVAIFSAGGHYLADIYYENVTPEIIAELIAE